MSSIQLKPSPIPAARHRTTRTKDETGDAALLISTCVVCLVMTVTEPLVGSSRLFYMLALPLSSSSILIGRLRRGLQLFSPLGITCLVWGIAIPLTSSQAPLMRAMTVLEIQLATALAASLTAGIFLAGGSGGRPRARTYYDEPRRQRLERAADMLLAVSIAALLVNTALEGRFALTDLTGESRKATAQFFGYPIASSLGTASGLIYAWSGRISRARGLVLFAFLALQVASSQRFVAIVAILLIIVGTTVSPFRKGRTDVRAILVGALALAAVFFAVSTFRGGVADQQKYFIDTGIYTGSVGHLRYTEPVRYIGMSQRNMSTVFERERSSSDFGKYSLSPISGLAGTPPTGLDVSTFGYTATNMAAYLYSDFGNAWWTVLVAIGFLTQRLFLRVQASPTLANAMTWACVSLILSFGFFAFVHAFIYWTLFLPAMVAILDRLSVPLHGTVGSAPSSVDT